MPRKKRMVCDDGTPVPEGIAIEKVAGRYVANYDGNKVRVFLGETIRVRRVKYPDGREVPEGTPVREDNHRRFAFDPISGREVEVFTQSQLAQKQWRYLDGRIVPKHILIRWEGNKPFAQDPDNEYEEVAVVTLGQLSQKKFKYLDGRKVPKDIPIRREGERFFAVDRENEDREVEVFYAYKLSQLRLQFLDGRDVPKDTVVLHEDKKHYVLIGKEKIEVFPARVLASRRSHQAKKEKKDKRMDVPGLLAHHSGKRARPSEELTEIAPPSSSNRIIDDGVSYESCYKLGFFTSELLQFIGDKHDDWVIKEARYLDTTGVESAILSSFFCPSG